MREDGTPRSEVRLGCFLLSVWIVLIGGRAFGSVWIAGEEEHPWERVGTLVAVDMDTDPGWIQPIRLDSTVNLAPGYAERGGWVASSDVYTNYSNPAMAVDGDAATTMLASVLGYSLRDTLNVYLDLGAIFSVSSVRFYPRERYEDNAIHGYNIYVNDGSNPLDLSGISSIFSELKWVARDELDWKLVSKRELNPDVVDVRETFPLQHVRYIRLEDTHMDNRPEIAELEVYGEGFIPKAEVLSHIFDLGSPADFGDVRWSAAYDPNAFILLRTRTGKTPDPYLYYKLSGVGPRGEQRVTKAEYERLQMIQLPSDGGKRLDTDNWSSWSAPYQIHLDREPMLSPGPARYFQFRIEFISHAVWDGAKLDYVAFEYAAPPVASRVVAESAPQEVVAGEMTRFEYGLRATFEPGDRGFDALEILTPMEVDSSSIGNLKIGGVLVEGYRREVKPDRFTVYFPEHRLGSGGESTLELSFDCRVLVYGTKFMGRVFDSVSPEIGQWTVAGDATEHLSTDDLIVTWPLGGDLITLVDISPNPVTPNGDGVNDVLRISYALLQSVDLLPVSIEVYDLSGSLVWRHSEAQGSGFYVIPWDGRDDGGKLVFPGTYVYRISVRSKAGEESKSGSFVVAY